MIVVMPAGHTNRTGGGRGAPGARDEFNDDFTTDVMPYVEKNYRALTDRAHRAVAGLSMGGGQTLTAFIGHPDAFAYVGVFSSGVLSWRAELIITWQTLSDAASANEAVTLGNMTTNSVKMRAKLANGAAVTKIKT